MSAIEIVDFAAIQRPTEEPEPTERLAGAFLVDSMAHPRCTMSGPGTALTGPALPDSWLRGTEMPKRTWPTPAERFWRSVDRTGPCWLWTKKLTPSGYGRIKAETGMVYAHRFAYEALVGPIPDGHEIDHLCRVRHCVNPAHLEAVSHTENLRRARRPFCRRGHVMTPDNVRVNSRGDRQCKTCAALTSKAWWRRRQDAG